MNGIFEMITNDLRCERLDETVLQSKEYIQAQGCAQETLAKLQEGLSHEARALLEEYVEQSTIAATIYDQQAYQQGMKDLMGFLLSLVN